MMNKIHTTKYRQYFMVLVIMFGVSACRHQAVRSETKKPAGADVTWSSVERQDKATKGQGAMQKSLDTWLKEEWNPTFEHENNKSSITVPNTMPAPRSVDKSKAAKSQKHKLNNAPTNNETTNTVNARANKRAVDNSDKKNNQQDNSYNDADQPFTLQHYYDKIHQYLNRNKGQQ